MTEPCMSPLFCCAFKASAGLSCVTSALQSDGQKHATLFTDNGQFMKLCISSAPSSNTPLVSVHEPMPLVSADPQVQPEIQFACWDAYSGSVYGVMGEAVVRLSEEGDATIVAGHLTQRGREDGAGLSARFKECNSITADGEGCLYVLDDGRLRRLQLPAAWRAAQPGAAGGAAATEAAHQGSGEQQQQQQQGQGEQRGAGTGPAGEQVQVATIPVDTRTCVQRVAHDPAGRSLVLCTDYAVYRLPVEGLGTAAPGTVHRPVLLAGRDENDKADFRDGVGPEAVFRSISDVAVDGTGTAWVLDGWREHDENGYPDDSDNDDTRGDYALLRRIDPSGRVATVPPGPLRCHKHSYSDMAFLGNGYLALVCYAYSKVLLLHIGCPQPPPTSSAPAPGTLSSDLGELLDRQPDGSADVEVEVGGQVFAAHRGVLAARSPYFRQRLDPGAGFADGRAPRLSLPDADPAAFGAVLRFMYTDSAGPLPPELLQPVGELADRLLLPGLCAQVGSQLLGRVCAESVVGLLLWAEQRSGSFGALLGGLKEWFLQHYKPGEEGTLPEAELKRLMGGSPDLALQLMHYRRADGQGGKRKRQE